jgi:glycine/D-amino acid oxidase-like deaminating enzyme
VKIRSKEPYWLLKNGIINAYPSLRKNASCDILIVGGGLSGALMAYRFASSGYKTIVVDKRDIGAGSTSANTSMIQYELDEPLYGLIDSFGKNVAIDIYSESVKAVKNLQHIVRKLPVRCEFERKKSLHFASTLQDADGLMKEFECRKMAGIEVKWLTKKEIRSSYGIVSEGGILSNVGASLDAYQLTHGLMEYAITNFGTQVYDHTQITSAQYDASGCVAYMDTLAEVRCATIIYSTGYEAHELVGDNIGRLISTYACVSEPIDNLSKALSDTIFWNTEEPYFYFRCTSDDRLLIGGEDEDFHDPDKRDHLIDKKEIVLTEKLQACLPGIDFVADYTWAGTFGATKDSLPYIGPHPDFPNCYFVLAYGGNGITFSLMAMDILSDALANQPNKFLEYFKFNR